MLVDDVIFLAYELDKLKGASVGAHTQPFEFFLLGIIWLEYILPNDALLASIIEIVGVDCGGREAADM
jgi:hypothetical protein